MITTLPLIIPFITIIFLLIAGKNTRWSKYIGITGTIALFLASIYIFLEVKNHGIQVTQVGGWEAPYGITLVIDMLSASMLLFSYFTAVCVGFYALRGIDEKRHKFKFFLFFHSLIMGVSGALIAGDIFNMYVWFEVMLISSFVLVALGSEKTQLEGSIKYVIMNLLGSMFFLAGIGLLYGKTGTLNMADLSVIIRENDQFSLMHSSFILFFVAFSIKAAVFPFFFWLPSSYHTPPITITALFAALLTKVGVYAMIRFFTLYMVELPPFWQNLLIVIAGLTMVLGVLSAASQYDIRKILSFHIISQIGYIIMGLAIFTEFAIAAAIFFMVHNIISKTAAFLAGGLIYEKTGSYQLKNIGGLFTNNPWLALFFFIPGLALAGLPPLSGFFGKLFLVKGGFENGNFIITAIAIWVGIVTLFSMLKIWNEAFWKPAPNGVQKKHNIKLNPSMMYSTAILAFSTLVLGIFAKFFMEAFMEASSVLKNPEIYIEAVLK